MVSAVVSAGATRWYQAALLEMLKHEMLVLLALLLFLLVLLLVLVLVMLEVVG